MFENIGRLLELDLASQIDEYTKNNRRNSIAGVGSRLKRSVAKVSHSTTNRYPEASRKILGGIARQNGLEYLGAGVEYSVYRDLASGQVLKMHRDSANLDGAKKLQLAEEKERQRALLANYLGKTVICQSVGIDEHVFGQYQTVQVIQPFVSFSERDAPFQVYEPDLDHNRLADIVVKRPDAIESLVDFVANSFRMLDTAQALPDTNGSNNLLTTDSGLVLIDTTPISASEPIAPLVIRQLHSLESGLREVA